MQRCAIDDQYAINAGETEVREGYRTGDIERILAQLTPGFTDRSHGFPSSARSEARDVLRARLSMLFARYTVEFAPVLADIVPLGDTALVFGWHDMIPTPKEGANPIHERTRFAEVWKKVDGGWKVGLRIDNPDVTPALAAETVAALLSGALDPRTGAGIQP